MHHATRLTALLVVSIFTLLISWLPFNPVGISRVAAAPALSAAPSIVDATVSLGQQTQRTLTVTNNSSTASQYRLYEALALAPTAALRGQLPAELRRVSLPAAASRIDPQLKARLAAAPNSENDVVVYLSDQIDLSAAYSITNWSERGWMVYRLLHDHAEQSQAGIRALLNQRGTSYTPFWVVNALAVRATQADIQALANRAEIAVIQANQQIAVEPTDSQIAAAPTALAQCNPFPNDNNNPTCWNIRQIGADRVWRDFGVTGQGITVGNIDTGVNYTHVALVQQYRGYRGEAGFDHNYNWFTPTGDTSGPKDTEGHGTHTMGSMIARGNGTVDQPAVGVAPGARWIAAQGCRSTSCSTADLIAAAQWMLAPTDTSGLNPRPDLRPQIINNSWSGGSNNDFYAGYTAAWRAAGIFPVFAAGNRGEGATCSSIASPGDYPDVVGVGATDTTDTIANFSTRGPTQDGRMKPDVSAPGTQIVSTYAGSNTKYAFLQGTSMAAPQVAGIVALLWSANPALIGDYDATYALLTGTTKQISDTRCGDAEGAPNNLYGFGRVQAYRAVAQAEVDVPWLSIGSKEATLASNTAQDVTITFDAAKVPGPGTYQARILINGSDLNEDPQVVDVIMTVPVEGSQATVVGTVRDALSNVAINGRVTVVDGASVPVDATGAYTITLPIRNDPYILVASAIGYLNMTTTVTLSESLTLTQPFSLTTDLQVLNVNTAPVSATVGIGKAALLTTTITNTGTRALTYNASIPVAQYGVWPSDEPQLAFDVPVPAEAIPVTLSDDSTSDDTIPLGFDIVAFGARYSEISINANGIIGLGSRPATAAYKATCGATTVVPGAALLPFNANLDPSQGGEISYASTNQGMVITYDNVPLHQAIPTDDPPTYTFQVLIQPNGTIVYRYGALGPLPTSLNVGIQRTGNDGQTISCGNTHTIQPGRSLELRPQPSTDLWAGLLGDSGVIEPGDTAELSLSLIWIRPNGYVQPLRGEIVITSDDPRQSEARVPFLLTTEAAPYNIFFPIAARR